MRKWFRQWLDSQRRSNKIIIGKEAKLHNQGHLQQTTIQIIGVDSCVIVAVGATICDMNILMEGEQNEIKIGSECMLDGDFMNKTNGIWG